MKKPHGIPCEYEYLLHLLRCAVHGAVPEPIPDGVSFEQVLQYGMKHEVANIAFLAVKKQLLAIKDRWFNGIEPEIDVSELENEILISGNHGVAENYYKHKFKRERAQGKHFVKIRYLLDFLFPKKEDIYSSYPFCEKHRLPAVLCWIHRWIFSVFNKRKWENVKAVFSKLKIKIK